MVNLHMICASTVLFLVASASPQLWRSQRPLSWTDRPFGGRSSGAPNPAILLDEKTSDALGNYHFRYATADGTKHEEKGRAGDNHAVRGSYSFISPEGEKLEVAYTADERGYRALGAHIPTMPPHALQQIKDAQRAAKGQHSGNRLHQSSNTNRQSGNKRHQSGNAKRPSGNTKRPSGNTKRPSGNRRHQSGNTKRPSGNTKRPSGSKTNHFGITRHQSGNRLPKSSNRLHRPDNKRPQSSKPKRQSSNKRSQSSKPKRQSSNKRHQSSKPKRQSSNRRHQSNNKRYQSGLHQSSSKRNQQRIKTINHFQNIFNRQKTRTNSKKASTWPDTRISFPPSFL